MRWVDPQTKQWTPLFDEGSGKERISIEKGEIDVYRIRYWRGDKEALIHFRAGSQEELAQVLINEGLFNDDDARITAERIAGHP